MIAIFNVDFKYELNGGVIFLNSVNDKGKKLRVAV